MELRTMSVFCTQVLPECTELEISRLCGLRSGVAGVDNGPAKGILHEVVRLPGRI